MADRTRLIELDNTPDFELAGVDPREAHPIAVTNLAQPIVEAGEPTVGEVATAAEATQRLVRTGAAPAGVVDATLRVAQAVAGARDVLTDRQAFAMVARRHGDPPTLVDAGEPMPGGLDEVDREPNTLPAVLATSIFDYQREARIPRRAADVRWLTVYDLPNYLREGIRALGRAIFQNFGCFEEHERVAAELGEDALGSVKILANINGQGPSRGVELDTVATWIRQNGVPVEATELRLPGTIPGYAPRVILCATDDETFLMVDERRADGAPADALYIYSWRGGRRYYLADANRTERLVRVVALPAPARAVPPPVRPRAMRPPRIQAAPPAARAEVDAFVQSAARVDPTSSEKRAVLAALPQAPAVANSTLSADLRRAGFRPFGPQVTPTLRKPLEDGRIAEVVGEPGVSMTQSSELTLRILDGDALERDLTISSLADFESAIEAQPRP